MVMVDCTVCGVSMTALRSLRLRTYAQAEELFDQESYAFRTHITPVLAKLRELEHCCRSIGMGVPIDVVLAGGTSLPRNMGPQQQPPQQQGQQGEGGAKGKKQQKEKDGGAGGATTPTRRTKKDKTAAVPEKEAPEASSSSSSSSSWMLQAILVALASIILLVVARRSQAEYLATA